MLVEEVLWNVKCYEELPGICSDKISELLRTFVPCVPFECVCIAHLCLPETMQQPLTLYWQPALRHQRKPNRSGFHRVTIQIAKKNIQSRIGDCFIDCFVLDKLL